MQKSPTLTFLSMLSFFYIVEIPVSKGIHVAIGCALSHWIVKKVVTKLRADSAHCEVPWHDAICRRLLGDRVGQMVSGPGVSMMNRTLVVSPMTILLGVAGGIGGGLLAFWGAGWTGALGGAVAGAMGGLIGDALLQLRWARI